MSWTEMVLCWIAGNVNKKHRSLLGLPETAQNCPRTLQEGSRDASKGGRKISQPPPSVGCARLRDLSLPLGPKYG